MSNTIAITPNNQIHLPLHIRKALNIKAPGKAYISVEKDRIIIEPIKISAVLDLAGSYAKSVNSKKNRTIDVENVRDIIDYSKL